MLNPVPPSECVSAREAASRRLDGELSELESARLDAHLRRCSACRELTEQSAAIVAQLRHAPLETPNVAVFAPRRRRPASMSRLQAAAAVLAVVAAGSSFALGQVVGSGSSAPAPTAAVTTPTDLGPAGQDEIEHYLLALLPRSDQARKPQVGSAAPV